MKRHFFIFLLFGVIVLGTSLVAYGDNDGRQGTVGGVNGIIYGTDPNQGGAEFGHCGNPPYTLKANGEPQNLGMDCTRESPGALTANCEWFDRAHTKLTCTTRECDESRDYVLRKGFGVCWKKERAEKWCKDKIKTCNAETEVPSPVYIDNPYGKRGKAFDHECFCANRNPVAYTCGTGGGRPPVDNETYTNVSTVTVKENTCTKNNATFVNWLCGSKTFSPGQTFTINGSVTCVAQWQNNVQPPVNTQNNYFGKVLDANTKDTLPQANILSLTDNTKGCVTNQDGVFGGTLVCSLPSNAVRVSYVGYTAKDVNLDKDIENVIELAPDTLLPEINIEECGLHKVRNEAGDCVCENGYHEDEEGNCVKDLGKCEKLQQEGATPERLACCKLEEQGITKWEEEQCKCLDDTTEYVYEDGVGKCNEKPLECPEGSTGEYPNCNCTDPKKIYDPVKNECVDNELPDLEKDYKQAKKTENSFENRTLTALTTAATGLGGKYLAQGLAEQSADKKAEADMAAYIKTMRCSYGSGNFVTAGPEPVELPGGNDATLMSLRSEYIALAKSLKERKESLGLKPGIESEEILDKANMGLYDDENLGITGGQYGSLYRATALNSEDDQAQINAEKEKSANRVKYGGIAVGAGVVVGVAGNQIINGKLGEKINKSKTSKKTSRKTQKKQKASVIQHQEPEKFESESPVYVEEEEEEVAYVVSTANNTDNVIRDPMTGSNIENVRTSSDEPNTNAGEWDYEKYEQCFVNFFPKNDRYSSNVRSYWAKSHNGKYCSGYTGGKYIYNYKNNRNTCSQRPFTTMNSGEWEIALRNGKKVRGIAVCNNTSSPNIDDLRDDISTTHDVNGRHCWCKITQTDLQECLVTEKFSWEYKGDMGLVDDSDMERFNEHDPADDSLFPDSFYTLGQNVCPWQCADECAYNLLDYGRHRQRQMHGVPLIREYIFKFLGY